ncbi:MAG: ABC transporter permease [Bacteroidia bacterium]|nr:ABC transporter permease [Bacteroidia bacterium]
MSITADKSHKTAKIKSNFNLVLAVAVKDVKVRYKNSFLGIFWSMINPLIYLIVFSIVFSNVFPDIKNYPLFALTGLIFWVFFSTTSNQMLTSITSNKGILKSMNISPLIFPISTLISGLIIFLLSLVPFMIIMVLLGFTFSWVNLLIFPIIALLCLFLFGVSLTLATLNVFFRDVEMLWTSLIPALFYFTPIVYSFQLIPPQYIYLLKLNPLYHYFTMIKSVLYYNELPELNSAIIATVLSLIVVIIGMRTYKKFRAGFISYY